MRYLFAWMSVLALIVTACRADPGTVISQALADVLSTAASSRAVAGAWIDGSLPSHFASRALAQADRDIANTIGTLQEQQSAASTINDVIVHVHRLRTTIAAIREAVDAGDADVVERRIRQLALEEDAIRTIPHATP